MISDHHYDIDKHNYILIIIILV